MVQRTLALTVLFSVFALSIGCGGSVTSPTRIETTAQTSNTPAPAPAAPPPEATSTPAPPAPAPAPPAPTPAPQPKATPVWDASTTVAHWYDKALLPSTFAVSWTSDTVTFGPITAAPIATDDRSILVRLEGPNPEISILFDAATGRGSWTYSGVKGQAAGLLVRR